MYKSAIGPFTKVGGDPAVLKSAVSEGVVEGFRKLAKFMEDEYRQHARPAAGVWCIPEGDKLYTSAIRYVVCLPSRSS